MDWIVLSWDHEDRTGNVSFRVTQPEVSDLPLPLAAIESQALDQGNRLSLAGDCVGGLTGESVIGHSKMFLLD